ncbi:MAG: aldo/keto reductase [Firmicutes bacterium]|jgi:predicted aldo/keto reductase-like oxidoreductase|nr:aldo/keto reductase [Bacillota bacterium]HPU01431.1 aldo/keto reductase [Bacillota bacterium]
MNYRKLGKTGLTVSEIGFGGIPLQRITPDEAVAVVREALRLGINFFDSARGYTDSEEKLGRALQGIARKEEVLASKSKARRKEEIKRDIETSLRHFRTEYLDLYQLHELRPETVGEIISPGGALEGLREAQREGKVRFIGITGHIPSLLLELLQKDSFDTVQFPFNYIERDALAELLPFAIRQNVGTIIMKPLAGGVFSDPAAALKFILKHDISTAIPGMQDPAEVKQNASASGIGLTAAEEERLRGEAEHIGRRFCRRCAYCLPCPQGIDIPMQLILKRYSEGYGLHQWALERYLAQEAKSSDCLECGECEEKCPYKLPIRELLQECRRLFEG